MRRLVSMSGLLVATALLAGCMDQTQPPGAPIAPPASETSETDAAETSERASAKDALAGLEANVSGMDLYMHDIEPTGDARRKPTLWVHAAEGQLKPDSSWALGDARAVIYREKEEDIYLESKAGRFDESNKTAVLEGGVKVAAGNVQLATESVSYHNDERIVQTHAPVQLSNGKTILNAQAATLEPEGGTVTLTNVSGTLSLDGAVE